MSQTVQALSQVRQMLDAVEQFINNVKGTAQQEGAGRELALVLTKVEEARMWAGKGLKHFDTGFVNSDQAGKPDTFSKQRDVVDAEVIDTNEEEAKPTEEVSATPTESTAQAN